jgi:hypothetical protein
MIKSNYTTIGSDKLGSSLIISDIKPEEVRVENNLVVYRNSNIWIVLQKTLHRDLAKELAEKIKEEIILDKERIDVDQLYLNVESCNTKPYLLKRGCSVNIGGKIYTKAVYSSGNGLFYKDMETKEWVRIYHIEGESYIQR